MYELAWLRCILSSAYILLNGVVRCYPVLSVESTIQPPSGSEHTFGNPAMPFLLSDKDPNYGKLFAVCENSYSSIGLRLFTDKGLLLAASNSLAECQVMSLKGDKLLSASRFSATSEKNIHNLQKNPNDKLMTLTFWKSLNAANDLQMCQITFSPESSNIIFCFSLISNKYTIFFSRSK